MTVGAEARKVVTIVFADLIGSTSLHERLDAESTRRLMDRYYRVLRAAIEAHGGTVVKLLGDGVMAAFGVPRVAEDDAIRAVRAGVAIVEGVKGLGVTGLGDRPLPLTPNPLTPSPLSIRVGINTGEVIVSADNTDVVGDPANVAARLQQEARDGEVVIGEATRRLVSERVTLAHAGVFSLKGRAETVAAYRVVSLERPAGAAATAFVGRDDELRRMLAVYDAAVSERRACLAVTLGSPGLGKSRLIEELSRRLGEQATVLTAQCESAGGATFVPIARAVRAWLRIDEGAEPVMSSLRPSLPGRPLEEGSLSRMGAGQGAGDPTVALRTAIEGALPGDDAERRRIAAGIAALLAGTPGSPEETFFVVRRFLTALATARPVVLTIDDLQWAEPLLLDLVEHLVQWGKNVPLLVLAAARPELRDMRSSLTAPGSLVSEVVTLAGLDAGAAMRLAADVIGADVLPAAVAGRVLATSEGNPLFVGELVRMLVDDGALRKDGAHWTTAVDLATLDMPPTIHALLAARIERLRPDDRLVLERAAVVGRQFSRSAVAHLLTRDVRDLDARLEALRRSELIEPDTTWFLGEPALRFHHGLTRDAAYRQLLKETRAELHERCAGWIEGKVGDLIEHDELLGWHLEQAHQHLRELGAIDSHGRVLGERAARHLGAAGRRALARDDVSVAADLLGRALHVLDAADPARAELALDWCEALLAAGDVGHAAKAIDELGCCITVAPLDTPPTEGGYSGRTDEDSARRESSRSSRVGPVVSGAVSRDRLSAWHTCFTGQLAVLTDPQALRTTVDALAAAATVLAELGDAAGEAKAHQVHAQALQRLGSIGACEAALDKALAAARHANDRRRANAVLAGAPLAALWGPSPVTRASGRCLDVVRVLRITQGAPAVEAVALRCQAVLEALRGRTEAARRMIAAARTMVEELGITQQVLETDLYIGLIELFEGNAPAAEASLRAAYDGFRAQGLAIDAARAAALLGRALFVQGNVAEAEALSHESEALAGDDLQAAIAWRRVRAEALASRGEHAAAVEVARTAGDIAGATDALLLHATARMALAAALEAAGRPDAAAAEAAAAIELWEAKGATVLAERAGRGPERDRRRVRDSGHPRRAAEGIPASAGMTNERTAPVLPHHQAAHRRVRPNAAIANAARLDATMAARDAATLATLEAEDRDVIDHPTGTTYDRAGNLASRLMLLKAKDLTFRHEPLATLGDSLALFRLSISAGGFAGAKFDVGSYEREIIVLTDSACDGSLPTELFAVDQLGVAVARLYERYAELLPDGPARNRAATTARSVAAMMTLLDLDRIATALDPAIEVVDHRPLGFPPRHGAEQHLQALRSVLDVSTDAGTRVDDILGLDANALLLRWTQYGTARASGGAYERPFLMLFAFGPGGLATWQEMFAPDRDVEALARFDELTGDAARDTSASPLGKGRIDEASGTAHVANAATRLNERFARAWAAGDWDSVAALHAPTLHVDDRRRLMQMRVPAEPSMAQLRVLFDVPGSRWTFTPIATRGDRLSLSRVLYEGDVEGGGGPLAIEYLSVDQVDGDGCFIEVVFFDVDDLDAAYTELDTCYVAGEGAAYGRVAAAMGAFARAISAWDWDGLSALVTLDFVIRDHGPLGREVLRGRAAYLESLKSLVDLAPDVRLRRDCMILSHRAALAISTWVGTREGGAFEAPRAVVFEFAPGGQIRGMDLYNPGQLDEARARFEALGKSGRLDFFEIDQVDAAQARFEELRPDPLRIPPNAATRASDRHAEALAARDLEALTRLCSPTMIFDDRRRGVLLTGDRTMFVASNRITAGARVAHTLLATAGDRLALEHLRWNGGASGQNWVVENLSIHEVDAEGRTIAVIAFDPDDRRAAFADAQARFVAGEAAAIGGQAPIAMLVRAFGRHDWATLRGSLVDDFVFRDDRTLGLLGALGPDEWVESMRVQADRAPDVDVEAPRILTWNRHGRVDVSRVFGTLRDGGPFENVLLRVMVTDGDRIRRMEVFDVGDADRALTRFAELCAERA
jgi:class 3 adenylate cyclase/tetratricopeptide (TPR) repeat protein